MAAPSSDTPAPHTILDSDFLKRYCIGAFLGKGSYAHVYAAIDRTTGREVALKVMSRAKLGQKGEQTVRGEVQVMASLNHPRILRLHQAVFGSKAVTLVLDNVKGGELFKHLVKLTHYSEKTAAMVMKNLMTGIKYMHDEGFCHRDLKPDNMLLVDKPQGPRDEVTSHVIADFGFATKYQGVPLTQPCGTPYYIAPDVLDVGLHKTKAAYDHRVDNWSCGVIGYIVLCGYPPFHADTKAKLFKLISDAHVNFHHEPWPKISSQAKDFILRLLARNADHRMTASQALKHPWLAQLTANEVPDKHLPESKANLENFEARTKLKGAIFGVEATFRLAYLAKCEGFGIKSNSAVVEQLIESPAQLRKLDLKNNYLGPKGLQALTECLLTHSEVQEIDVTNCLLDDKQTNALLDTVLSARALNKGGAVNIRRLALDENPITHATGRRILGLLQQSKLEQASVVGTRCSKAIVEKVAGQSIRNKELRLAKENRVSSSSSNSSGGATTASAAPSSATRNQVGGGTNGALPSITTQVTPPRPPNLEEKQTRTLPPIAQAAPRQQQQATKPPQPQHPHSAPEANRADRLAAPGRHLISHLRARGANAPKPQQQAARR